MHLSPCPRCVHSFHGTAHCGVRMVRWDGPAVFCQCESPKRPTNWVVLVGILLALFGALYAAAFAIETATALWRF